MAGTAIIIKGADYSAQNLGKVTLKDDSKPITGIEISGPENIMGDGDQYTAILTPNDTTQTSLLWSIESGETKALISNTGYVTVIKGEQIMMAKVVIKCTSRSNSSIYATKTIYVNTGSSE